METHLKQVINQTVPQQKVMVNFDHIELTDEEIENALNRAKSEKETKLKTEAYRKKLFEKPVYSKWDFETLKAYVLENNPNFIIDEKNETIFDMLCQYFSGDLAFELNEGCSLNKGLILFGPIGCGKTSMMRMFEINTFKPYAIVACRKVADRYSQQGPDALYEFSNLIAAYPQQNFGHTHIGRCFDDLGTENSKKNFGNEVNVMQDVMYKIYDNNLIGKFHITTNLTSEEIDEYYGRRIRSRIREMFNPIVFDLDAPDRRK